MINLLKKLNDGIKGSADKINEVLDSVEDIVTLIYRILRILFIFVLLGVGGYYAYKFFKPDEPVQVVPVEKVTQEVVTNVVASGKDTNKQVFSEIQDAKNKNTKAAIVLPPTASPAEVQRAVDSLGGDIAISEPSSKPGTSIWSIKVSRAKYGIGFYVDSEKEVGLHYRNKRWIYQAGIDVDGKFAGRVAYELIQW